MTGKIMREEISPRLYYNSFVDSKYKSNRLSISMFMPLKENTVTEFALLSGVIGKSCAKYNTLISLNKKLSELYGANLSSDVVKLGEMQGVTLHLSFISNKYAMDNEDILQQAIDLIFEILLNPNVDEKGFKKDEVDIEKVRLIDLLESEINDKRRYAVTKCLQNMYKDQPYAIPKYGYKEKVNDITCKKLYEEYQNLLKQSRVEVFFVGSDDEQVVKNQVSTYFNSINRQPIRLPGTCGGNLIQQPKEIVDSMDITQSKLVMGFKCEKIKTPEQNVIMTIAMLIYGITPNSKLFLNVRERLSLCYYCSAQYDKYRSILFVDSGIEHDKKDQTVDEINIQLDAMKKGDFKQEDIDSALLYYINGYKGLYDSPGTVEAFYLGNAMSESNLDPNQMIEIAKKVSKQDIVDVCQDIHLDTIYFLTGVTK